jgi:lantibiotic modifying enzyme
MNDSLIDDPKLKNEIINKIKEIGDCLLQYSDSNIYLMGGKTGVVLFWAYYSRFSDSVNLKETLIPLVSEIIQGIRTEKVKPSFAEGLAGIGWAFEHLKKEGFIELDTDSIIGCLDDFLFPYMMRYVHTGDYDYLHGALGFGLYYLNRSSNPKTKLYIIELVDELEKKGIFSPDGIAWESKLYLEGNEKGYNLGLSHGLSSIVSVLNNFNRASIHSDKTLMLVTRAINYLLGKKHDVKYTGYSYPAWITENESHQMDVGRLAWCYNDLGVSMALWQAGQTFNKLSWKQEAIKVLLSTTEITDWKKARVNDACLCHGSAGIAHIYNRAYKNTGIEKFKESSIYWFEQSLKMARFDDGAAGFKFFRPPEYGGMEKKYGLLEGIAGIGLAMISAVSNIEPTWDKALILS